LLEVAVAVVLATAEEVVLAGIAQVQELLAEVQVLSLL
jgi:hypothetical protein